VLRALLRKMSFMRLYPFFLWPIVLFLQAIKPTNSSPLLSANWRMHREGGATAIVTGGTKGIGKAIVEELASTLGCRVLTCARSETDLASCLEEWKAQGLNVEGVVADVSTTEGRQSLISKAIELFVCSEKDGGSKKRSLDILVNNVGTNIRKATVDYTEDELNFVWQTNFASMYELTKLCHPLLKNYAYDAKNEGGSRSTSSVVNVGSVAGVTCMKSGTPYAATKAAMNQLTGNLGAFLAFLCRTY
jgi:Tropinone reductase 1